MRETDGAWLAAVIDGEGCLSYHYKYYKNARYKIPEISIANMNLDFLNRAKEIMEKGGIHKDNRKDVYYLAVRGRYVGEILKEILRYLIIKKDKALEMISYIDGRVWGPSNPEAREKISRARKRNWADPEYRSRMVSKFKAFWNTPEGRKIQSERMKKVWRERKRAS